MEFDSYSSYFNYVDWWYFDVNVSQEARFIYLRWDFAENGQERLEYDLNENGAGRTELQVGDKTFYYLFIDDPELYDIEWVQDGYLFGMNIPAEYIAPNGDLNESLLLKYTELNKKYLDTQSAQNEPTTPPQAVKAGTNSALDNVYDEIAKQYRDDEMAVIFPSDRTESNIHLVEQWIFNYQHGTPATLPVYWFGIAGPSIMIIESYGDKEYNIDIYSRNGFDYHYTSNYVVERTYDYVLGADFPADIHPIPIQKSGLVTMRMNGMEGQH